MICSKKVLHINGVDRSFICDPEKDTLALVLRRLGLTSVKIGCGIGVCGACNVILDGKLVRACTKKIKSVPDNSVVLTLEGIGTPLHLHPLQEAFMNLGAIQCGFCTPGFVVSAYALLQENPDPTREQVRAWFQKHRNACRCTGYKQIVDAVMAAAAVMRGEKTIEEIRYVAPADGKYYGTPLVRPTALAKVTGTQDYGEDIALRMPEGTLHAVLYLPRVAHHARVISLDVSEAEKMPGVVRVVTAKDIKGTNHMALHAVRGRSTTPQADNPGRTIFCTDKIVRMGDCLAAVVADTEAHARAAVNKIHLEYEALPAYLSVLESCMPNAIRIQDDIPNLVNVMPKFKGLALEDPYKVDELIDNSAFSVRGSFTSTQQPHLTIEGDTVQSYYDEDGLLTIQCKSQNVYGNIEAIGVAIGVPDEKMRIITNPVGGSFGWAIWPGSYAIAGVCTMATGMPVALHLTYEEHQYFSGKRNGSLSNAKLGCDKDGKITGAEYDIVLDAGAYRDSEYIMNRLAHFPFHGYSIPNIAGFSRIYNTNNAFGVAYRGFGSPQDYTCSEAIVDMLAEKSGIDPFEFRWRNIAREGDTTTSSYPYHEYPLEEIMTKLRPIYEEYKAEAQANSTPEKKRGVGVSIGGYATSVVPGDESSAAFELMPDGTFTHYGTWQEMGQGGDIGSMMASLKALEPLHVKPEDIHLVNSDTKYCPNGGPSGSSRQTFMETNAAAKAAEKLLNAMRKPDGTYRTYDEMVAEGIPTKYEGTYSCTAIEGLKQYDQDTGIGDPFLVNYMVNLAEVEVDTATGKTKVLRFTIGTDIGTVSNLNSALGQAYSGIEHGIGFALSEDYHDDGKHTNIASCGFPYIEQIPDDLNVIFCQNPRKQNAFGSVGCAEGFQSAAHMAVLNGIRAACGVRIYEMPALPAKVKAGLDKLAAGEPVLPPEKFFLGSDELDELSSILDGYRSRNS